MKATGTQTSAAAHLSSHFGGQSRVPLSDFVGRSFRDGCDRPRICQHLATPCVLARAPWNDDTKKRLHEIATDIIGLATTGAYPQAHNQHAFAIASSAKLGSEQYAFGCFASFDHSDLSGLRASAE